MAGESDKIAHDEIEALLAQAQQVAGHSPSPHAPPPHAPAESDQETNQRGQAAPAARRASATATLPPLEATSYVGSATRSAAKSNRVGDDIQFLLNQAEQAIASVDQPIDPAISGIQPFEFRDFGGSPASGDKATLELLRDVDLDVRIELGRTQMYLEDVLKLKRGAVVPLDKLAGDPVDVYVNGRLIARGEVLVLNDNFCVRVAELLTSDDV